MIAMIKPGVKIAGIQPEIVIGFIIATPICNKFGVDCVLTAVRDGKHMAHSKHNIGHAIDIRKRDLASDQVGEFRITLVRALGEEFDVVEHENHWHIEFDPERGLE